jgi:pimeloyl-ACP methyl ester carboxylesterase
MRKSIPLSHGRKLIAAYSKARIKTQNWIVFLPESGSSFLDGSRGELERFLNPRLASQFNYLAINKPGLFANKIDREMFESSFRRHLRIQDALKAIRTIIPREDRIFIIGYSEGAYLAPEVAARLKQVERVMMIGGGTRGWLKEELSNASKSERPALLRQIREILKNPASTRKWNGFSYATWNSYREDDTVRALKALKCHVYGILGAKDNVIDLKSARADLRVLGRQKGTIRADILKSCGHEFTGHWPKVRAKLGRYLSDAEDRS